MNKLLKVSIFSVFALVLLFSATSVFAARSYRWDAPYSNNTNFSNPRCTLVSFNARPASITAGQPVILSWSTRDCTSANISPIGNVSLSGTKTVYPTSTTHYALTAYGPGLDDDELQVPLQKTVTVDSSVNCNNIPFSASPSSIRQGQSSVLSWDATGCTDVTISSGGYPISKVNSKGRLSVSPTKTTTYAITAFPRGSFDELPVPSYTTVTVGGESFSGTISATTCSIGVGGRGCTPTITWSISNPVSVTEVITSSKKILETSNASSGTITNHGTYYPGETIYLYHDSKLVDQVTSKATCVSGSVWNGQYCKSSGLSNSSAQTQTQSQYQPNTTTEQYRSWKSYSIPSAFRSFSSWRNSYSR